jgi:hypothetical protein
VGFLTGTPRFLKALLSCCNLQVIAVLTLHFALEKTSDAPVWKTISLRESQ